ncbi:MAG: A24 family peptidase [Alphaproteobacteria bacterium]|jgi:prepilin signal peptidase PulO-like enzyme (type II secretory pathway)|nr:A24 family peptidase [Alphaproteobacteria bacterium]
MLFTYSLLLLISLPIIYQDVRHQTVPLWGLIVFAIVSLGHQIVAPNPEGRYAAGVLSFIFIVTHGIFYLLKRKPAMGWGDLILVPFCGLWLNQQKLPLYLILTGIFALLTGLIWRHRWGLKTYPLTPALLLGLGIVSIIHCFITMNEV